MRIINESSRRAIAKSDLHTKPTYNQIGEFYKRDINSNFKIIDAKVNGRIIDIFSRSIKSDVVLFTLRGDIYPTWHTIGKISGDRHSVDLSGMNVFFGIRADAEKRLTKHHLIRGDIDKIEVSTGLFGIREFSRTANSEVNIYSGAGTTTYDLAIEWQNADFLWDEPDVGLSTILAKAISRNVNTSISVSGTAGTAGYQSNLLWENADVSWGDNFSAIYQSNASASISLGTTTINYDLSKVIERNASSEVGLEATAGTAGYTSNLLWENADVDWQSVSGGIYESSTSASLSIDITLNYFLADLEVVNASANISLTTNANQTMIAGWNSETTSIENLTRNWEAT
jgi:hypothetical protein